MATTASQMLRDDQRLRNLHRETKKRRKRFLAKQKRIEEEEERRRVQALQQRREKHTRNVTSVRRHGNRPRKRSHPKPSRVKPSPVRVERRDIVPIDGNAGGSPSYIVPVCDRMASPSLSPAHKPRKLRAPQRPKVIQRSTKCPDPDLAKHEELKREEELDHFEQDSAMSDQLSVAELEQFEMRHFGAQRSVQKKEGRKMDDGQHALSNKENECQQAVAERSGGYQAIFKQKVDYKKTSDRTLESMHSANGDALERHKELFSVKDVDLKSPEDNDSVKINPNDSIDCGKLSFSTVYDSNLLPLQSAAFQNPKPPQNDVSRAPPPPKTRRFPEKQRFRTRIPEPSKRLKCTVQRSTAVTEKNYGIKLPRLTRSILQEKDRMDSRQRPHRGPLPLNPPQQRSPMRSVLSAPAWIRKIPQDIGYSVAVHRKRKTTSIIDDFFKNSEEFKPSDPADSLSIRQSKQSNRTLFLPQIKRPRPKNKGKYPGTTMTAHSVMADQDILREEMLLEQSLDRLNERLSNLDRNGRDAADVTMRGLRRRNGVQPRNAMYSKHSNEKKVDSVPRKLKTKKSPTFKSSRQRGRWNL